MQPILSHADQTSFIVNQRFFVWPSDFLLAGRTKVEKTQWARQACLNCSACQNRICFLISCPLVIPANKNTAQQIQGEQASIFSSTSPKTKQKKAQGTNNPAKQLLSFCLFTVSDSKCEVGVGGCTKEINLGWVNYY